MSNLKKIRRATKRMLLRLSTLKMSLSVTKRELLIVMTFTEPALIAG